MLCKWLTFSGRRTRGTLEATQPLQRDITPFQNAFVNLPFIVQSSRVSCNCFQISFYWMVAGGIWWAKSKWREGEGENLFSWQLKMLDSRKTSRMGLLTMQQINARLLSTPRISAGIFFPRLQGLWQSILNEAHHDSPYFIGKEIKHAKGNRSCPLSVLN